MKRSLHNILSIIGGAAIGIANGFFGGGGGMLCVPLLEKVFHEETKRSHATAILIILPISIASAITYVVKGVCDWNITLYVGLGVLAGGLIGALLLGKLKSDIIAIIFALIMIGVGIRQVIS